MQYQDSNPDLFGSQNRKLTCYGKTTLPSPAQSPVPNGRCFCWRRGDLGLNRNLGDLVLELHPQRNNMRRFGQGQLMTKMWCRQNKSWHAFLLSALLLTQAMAKPGLFQTWQICSPRITPSPLHMPDEQSLTLFFHHWAQLSLESFFTGFRQWGAAFLGHVSWPSRLLI